MGPIPGNIGVLWYTTWQLCCENNSNDLGYKKYTNFSKNLYKLIKIN